MSGEESKLIASLIAKEGEAVDDIDAGPLNVNDEGDDKSDEMKEENGDDDEDDDEDDSSGDVLSFSCLEKEERIADFLEACSKLDAKRIHHYVSNTMCSGSIANSSLKVSEMVDNVGQNGLHYVAASSSKCCSEESSIVEMLADANVGLDINKARKSDGWTPLFLAVVFNRLAMVAALLNMGADVKVRDNEGHDVEHWAKHFKLNALREILMHQ